MPAVRERVTFWVRGRPVQKGNHKAVCPMCMHGRPGHPYVVDDWSSALGKRLAAWCRDVVTASNPVRPRRPWLRAVGVHVIYFFERPKSNKDLYPTTESVPDGDKLERAVWDALQIKGRAGGRVMGNDAQVIDWSGKLRWADERGHGALVTVESYEPEQLALTDDAPLLPVRRCRPPGRTRAKKTAVKGWF